ncbi:unnamed protein product [Spodoptera littoralis]|uniref:Uncharacterized protein n=1 Tax=Spodoptera littoralis TaxID=7109 RepID=A0A9P0HZR9_SPOLI|nr:unnamed protein product [Spodoptera littoralis]CAH1636985.1 unnamed protein product [Spodoptera littoralis]
MEGFCRGCLIKYNDPMELLQYTEKYRRLFVYSTGLQVKRNDTFTFQLCKDCFLNMKQACKFKKQCRTSDKQFKNYKVLKDVGDPIDFCTFLKNCDDALTFRLPLTSGNSTPATQKRDDDNESTCTSIRNFMTDILQGEEMPDTEARIIREVIEEEADVLEDSLDSHWLQDDVSIDTDFRLDFSFSPFSTPRSVNNDHCYTPKKYVEQKEQISFETVNTEKQTKILNDFTKAFQNDQNIKDPDSFENKVMEKPESFNSLKEFYPFATKEPIVNVDPVQSANEQFKSSKAIKDITSFGTKEMSTKEIELKRTFASKHLKELCDFSLDSIEKPDSNKNDSLKELCDMTLNEFGQVKLENDAKNDEKLISDFSIDEIDGLDKSVSNLDLPSLDYSDKDRTSSMNFYTENLGSLKSSNEMSNSSINIEALLKDKPCTIDRNLEEALKNPDNKEFSLDELLVSPPVFQKTSAASTPTINNILFNVKLELPEADVNTNKTVGQCIEPYDNVQGDIEIFEEFFRNDTKEFDIDDIKRANVDAKEQRKRDSQLISIKVENEDSNDMDFVETTTHKDNKQIENNEEIIQLTVEESEEDNKSINIDPKLIRIKFENEDTTDMDFEMGISKENKPIENEKTINDKEKIPQALEDGAEKEKSHCESCNKQFKNAKALSIHMTKIHGQAKKKASMNKNPVLCSECGLEMHDKSNFKRHLRVCSKPKVEFNCAICGESFSSRSKLKKHRSVHSINTTRKSQKQYICSVCNVMMHKRNNFILHIRRHEKMYSTKCKECGRGFYRHSDLKVHMRQHTGETPFKCIYCDYTFTRQDVLSRHMKIHLGVMKYECDTCGQKFKRKYDVYLHILKEKKCTLKRNGKIKKIVEKKLVKEAAKEVVKSDNKITVLYAVGANETIKKELPFLETELSN